MEKQIFLGELYDLYKELFTDKQQSYFEDYYFANLSYGEISQNYGVSRAAIYKQLKMMEEKLLEYEEKLKLYQKKQILSQIISEVDEKLKTKLERLL